MIFAEGHASLRSSKLGAAISILAALVFLMGDGIRRAASR
jgi:hypothetical protein